MQKFLYLAILSVVLHLDGRTQTGAKTDSIQPKITFKGLFQARYIVSLKKNVDVNGLHHIDGEGVFNSFDVRRARAQFTARISDRTEAVLLVNLADFKSDPKNKVLENAYLIYRLNTLLHFKIGQFRPAFGLEDTYSINIIKSFDYSNQYTAFGSNGWQSFQIGIGMFGDLAKDIRLQYEIDVINGNNRNQVTDDDNGKQATFRLQAEPKKNIKFGMNSGYGRHNKENIYAAGFDASAIFPMKNKFSLELETEWKQGNNHILFFNTDSSLRTGGIRQYVMNGFYILPNLRYAIAYRRLSSIELSCRYEYFDKNIKSPSNLRQTITPMIGLEFLHSYNARIQIGMVADIYQKNIEATTQYNNNLFILQIQTQL
ncbi:MAG: porin [Ginsengibacter sp.]